MYLSKILQFQVLVIAKLNLTNANIGQPLT